MLHEPTREAVPGRDEALNAPEYLYSARRRDLASGGRSRDRVGTESGHPPQVPGTAAARGLPHDNERRLVVIGTMIALGKWDEFRLHVRAALESHDLSIDDVKEILLQQTIYCGVPAANTAFREARDVIEEVAGAGRRKTAR